MVALKIHLEYANIFRTRVFPLNVPASIQCNLTLFICFNILKPFLIQKRNEWPTQGKMISLLSLLSKLSACVLTFQSFSHTGSKREKTVIVTLSYILPAIEIQ